MIVVAAGLQLAPGTQVATPASATFATGGSGLYKDSIDWIDWGTPGIPIANGMQRSTIRDVSGSVLTTTCTISNVGGQVSTYRPGGWRGDGLDDLYNVGGTNAQNKLIGGLVNYQSATTVTFDVSCATELDGMPIPMQGMVVADAEASGEDEYIKVTPIGSEANWSIIDRFRNQGCTSQTAALLNSGGTMTLTNEGGACGNIDVANGSGPIAVAFAKNATAFSVELKGGGRTAVALGAILMTDFGDAPESYGQAGAMFQPQWNGGELSQGKQLVSGNGFQMGKPGKPNLMLGSEVTAEASPRYSADALADQGDDAIPLPGPARVTPGGNYSISDIACTGSGFVTGWVDWNRNGQFDAGETSSTSACVGGKVNLDWTVPADAKPGDSFLRLRIASDEENSAKATGLATDGEVEDYAIQLTFPEVTISKTSDATADSRIGDVVTYSVTATNVTDVAFTPEYPAVLSDDLTGVLDDAEYLEDAVASQDGLLEFVEPRLVWAGPLEAGGSVTVTYSVKLKDGGDRNVKNVAFQGDPNNPDKPTPACDAEAPEVVDCEEFDLPKLQIAKTSDVTADVLPGDVVTYTVTATNDGPGSYSVDAPAVISDDMSEVLDDAEYLGDAVATVNGVEVGTVVFDGPKLSWSGPLAAGESVVITYTVKLGASGDGNVRNVAFLGEGETPECTVDEQSAKSCAEVEYPLELPGLLWQKVGGDSAATPLAGSEWSLVPLDDDGNQVSDKAIAVLDCVADSAADCADQADRNPAEGGFLVKPLKAGNYQLVETKAPAGFKLLTDPIDITISVDNLNAEGNYDRGDIVNEQQSVPTIPLTGGVGTFSILLTAGGIVLAAAVLMVVRARRQRFSETDSVELLS